MIKILKDETVYIPVQELAKGHLSIPAHLLETIEPYGEVISEANFNIFLMTTLKEAEEERDLELTKISSLSCQMDRERSIRPLKHMFLSRYMSDEAISEKIRSEEEEARQKHIREICSSDKHLLNGYKPAFMILENREYIRNKLDSVDLSIQFLTEVGESKRPYLSSFIVGKGIFHEIYLDDWDIQDFDRFARKEDGSVVIPDPAEYEDALISPMETDRDFREFSVMENIAWGLQNLPFGSDSSDYLDYHNEGINLSLRISFFMKLINPYSFPELFIAEGILDFTEKVLVPELPKKP